MSKFPVALQVYSVRDVAEKNFAETMRSVKAMGYDGVELAGTYQLTVAEVKKILDEVGLELVSAHVNLDLLEDDAVLQAYADTGIRYVAIPWLTGPQNAEELAAVIERIRNAGLRCKEKGMQLMYHNHDFEFKKIDGQYILDAYYQQISPELLQTELDTCWVNVGGENPAEYLRKYAGRTPTVHLKDFVGSKSENMYGLIGLAGSEAKADENAFQLRPVGKGKQDFPAIVAAGDEGGAQWYIVEQDEPSLGLSPLECARTSFQYLVTEIAK